MRPWLTMRWCGLLAGYLLGAAGQAGSRTTGAAVAAGPLFHEFRLTLGPGLRREALGPLWYAEDCWEPGPDGEEPEPGTVSESVRVCAVPPLFSKRELPLVGALAWDSFYPVITYDRYGMERWFQVLQLLSYSAGRDAGSGALVERFTLFPFYFQQRSAQRSLNYTGVLPFYGHLERRLFRDETDWVMWPVYAKTRKKDVVTRNYLVPFFHLRAGTGLTGWQLWPLAGQEVKAVTLRTNVVGGLETVPGHAAAFALWPLLFHNDALLGTTNPVRQRVFLPWYSLQLSPAKDIRTYLWPLGPTFTEDRAGCYHEWDVAWPFIGFGRGANRRLDRVFPLWSRALGTNGTSGSILWPCYRYRHSRYGDWERDATYGLLDLYADVTERNAETGQTSRRTGLWPLFLARRDTAGNESLQLFALLEPVMPRNESIVRNYSPLWTVYRAERNAQTGRQSEALLWNLYRCEHSPTRRKSAFLFGLVQYWSGPEGRGWRWLHLLGPKPPPAAPAPGRATGAGGKGGPSRRE
jgi:hypothetical protein